MKTPQLLPQFLAVNYAALFAWLLIGFAPLALGDTQTFTDSQGRSTLYRYSFKSDWDPAEARGVLIFIHGNQEATQQQVIDSFFPSVEQEGFKRGLIPVVITSPETRPPPQQNMRQWKEPDEALLHEILQSQFNGAFVIDYDRVFFDAASQGTCFIHDFLPDYGENYGGGFYAGCGCYNNPDALWNPSDSFKDRFRVFVQTTTGDFLYESAQEGYAYYQHTIGLNTRGDLERAGSHCSAYWTVKDEALNWLTGVSTIDEAPFAPHWERVFTGDNIAGATVDALGVVYLARNSANTNSSQIYSSDDGGKNWTQEGTLSFRADDIDAAGNSLILTSGPRLYGTDNRGLSAELLDSQNAYPTVVTDKQGNLYRGQAFMSKSSDLGESWQSLGGASSTAFAPTNSRLLNSDPIVVSDAQLITGHPFLQFDFNGQATSTGRIAVGSTSGNDWVSWLADTAPTGFFSHAAWDGSKLWALARGAEYPHVVDLYHSSDRGLTWTSAELPSAYAEYYAYNTRISVVNETTLVIHGDFNSSWLTVDSGENWIRAPGARTFGIANFALDPNGQGVYASDGESLFKLLIEEGDADGDGIADAEDNCPSEANANQQNSDGAADGGDACDAFPYNPAASIDADQDGLPDQWNPGCASSCQSNSNLTLDDNPNEHFDIDRDGFTNQEEIDAGTDPRDPSDVPAPGGLNMILIRAAMEASK